MRAIWVEAARYAPAPRVEFGIRKIGRILDDANRRGLVTWAALRESVDNIGERGRSGTRIMRALSGARPPGTVPTESANEDRLEETLAKAGVPTLRRQVAVGGYEPIGRADFRDHTLQLVVEVDSITYHSTPSDRAADTVRYQRYNDAGFTVAVIWDRDLWTDPRAVVQTVTEARRRAGTGERVVLHTPRCPWPRPLAPQARVVT